MMYKGIYVLLVGLYVILYHNISKTCASPTYIDDKNLITTLMFLLCLVVASLLVLSTRVFDKTSFNFPRIDNIILIFLLAIYNIYSVYNNMHPLPLNMFTLYYIFQVIYFIIIIGFIVRLIRIRLRYKE